MRIAGYCLTAASALALGTAAHAQDIAIKGGEVHTMAGPAITDGVVVIDDGKIVAVGPAAIERGLVASRDGVTEVRIHMLNTGEVAVARVSTPGGRVSYQGSARIDGVPGSHAARSADSSGRPVHEGNWGHPRLGTFQNRSKKGVLDCI